jgi:hypothetical protein
MSSAGDVDQASSLDGSETEAQPSLLANTEPSTYYA